MRVDTLNRVKLTDALETFWTWIAEKEYSNLKDANEHDSADVRLLARGSATAYQNIRHKVKTLFSGLIDFDE